MPEESVRRPQTKLLQKIGFVLLGVFLFCCLLEIGLRLGGLAFQRAQEQRNKHSLERKGAFRIMCLGESTTAAGGEHSYPAYLENILNSRSLGIRFSVINKGASGVNSDSILETLNDAVRKYAPQVVIAMMGVNDESEYALKDSAGLPFLEELRIYRLANLLRLHIAAKMSEYGIITSPDSLSNNHPSQKVVEFSIVQIDAQAGQERIIKLDAGQAEQLLEKAAAQNPEAFKGYRVIADEYLTQGKMDKAEQVFKKAIDIIPGETAPYFDLANLYCSQGRLSDAVECYNKIVEREPDNFLAWYTAGCVYRDLGNQLEAEIFFKKAAELNPKEKGPFFDLGWAYKDLGKLTLSEEAFKKALALDFSDANIYAGLGWVYRDQGKNKESKEMFQKAIVLNPKNDTFYAAMAVLYEEQGNKTLAARARRKAVSVRRAFPKLALKENYRKLKEILDEKNIQLICVQYPMRSIEPLKALFRGQEGVIFVDNERAFQDAVKKAGYKAYFTDMFGGDFGHCTAKGNRLLAQNIARVIIEKYFLRTPHPLTR